MFIVKEDKQMCKTDCKFFRYSFEGDNVIEACNKAGNGYNGMYSDICTINTICTEMKGWD
jgi:hypothetical protein